MSLTDLLPADLDLTAALALVLLSLVTSLITATFSLGGGTLMVAVLALVFPPIVVVPLPAPSSSAPTAGGPWCSVRISSGRWCCGCRWAGRSAR